MLGEAKHLCWAAVSYRLPEMLRFTQHDMSQAVLMP